MTKKSATTEKITLPEAKDALLRSGYLLESRIETLLRDHGYYVEANAAYPDPATKTSRELDVYAMAALRVSPGNQDFVFPVLIIECINNPQPIALLTKEPLVRFFGVENIKLSGLPAKIHTPQRFASSYLVAARNAIAAPSESKGLHSPVAVPLVPCAPTPSLQ